MKKRISTKGIHSGGGIGQFHYFLIDDISDLSGLKVFNRYTDGLVCNFQMPWSALYGIDNLLWVPHAHRNQVWVHGPRMQTARIREWLKIRNFQRDMFLK